MNRFDGIAGQVAFDLAGCDHLVDLLEHLLRVRLRFAFNSFGQQRSRSFGDAAAGTDKTDVLNSVSVETQEKFKLVAAQRVEALGGAGCRGHVAEIARLFAVVQDDLLVEIAKIVKH